MLLKEFWNKAIEHYCTYKRIDGKEIFDTVFIAVSEESLNKIKEKFILYGNLSDVNVTIIEKNIENVGGVINSYYYAVKDVHNELSQPALYSFLRFSIFVVGAFKQDNNPLRNFWSDFDSFLNGKGIKVITKGTFRTEYLQSIISNLSKLCAINHYKTFFDVNVFGENSIIINVGKIKAHSIFQGKSLTDIKKAIYNLGYSDSHNIEDLTFQDIEEILIDSGRTRILNLFQRDNDTREIVFICLLMWLKNWIPNQEEKVKLLNGRISSNLKSKIQINRIWTINSNNNIEIKFGFFLKSNLGEDNIFYLNKNKNIYVDVAWGIKINENRTLYTIENYVDNEDLNANELAFNFKAISNILYNNEYALEKVPNRMYFIEQNEDFVTIKDNPVLLASKVELNDENIEFFYNCKIENQQELKFNLYRIKDSIKYNRFSFIKTSNLNIYPIGISDGRQGVKSFLSSFPIKIKYNNLSNGEIHICNKDEIKKKIFLNKSLILSDCEENIGLLQSGNYTLKYFNEKGIYENFPNGKNSIDFEIVESGCGDRRIELKIQNNSEFKYHEFRYLKDNYNFEDSCYIFFDEEVNHKFKDVFTFFYFQKNNENEWIIQPNKLSFIIQKLNEKPIEFIEKYYPYHDSLQYLSSTFVKYDYTISFCERPKTINLIFNINDFYQRNEERRINSNEIKINCYYFRLESLDVELKEKYPNVEVGDVIYIISNKFDSKPENLIKLLNQEVFPFKK
jgi:hypothetical protein